MHDEGEQRADTNLSEDIRHPNGYSFIKRGLGMSLGADEMGEVLLRAGYALLVRWPGQEVT